MRKDRDIVTLPYRHRQTNNVLFWTFGVVGLLVIALWVFVPRESLETEAEAIVWNITMPGVLVLFAGIGFIFRALEVSVDREHVAVRFGPLRKSISVRDIRAVSAVRNRWYYGWGIRLTPNGWLWNAAGLDAVQLELSSGKSFRIGSDESGRLVAVIREAANLRVDDASEDPRRVPRDRSRRKS